MATLESVWTGEGDYGLEVGLLKRGDLRAPAMRRAWDARRAGRAVPLVLIQPLDGALRICGPSGPPPPVRDLPEAVAVKILRRALALPPEVVVDALRAELARGVGSSGVPGVWNNGLVSSHYLLEKLPENRGRWERMTRAGQPALGREGRDIFAALGYEISAPAEGELLLHAGGAPVALVHAYRGAHLFDRFIEDVGAPASAYVLARARAQGASYGLLVAGTVARLLSRQASADLGESAPSAAFLDVAMDLLPLDKAGVIGACYAPDALRDGGDFAFVREASERYAVGLRERFRDRVYADVVPALVRGIARAANAQRIAIDGKLLYRATMLALFRTLFVLYAEDRDLLPVASPQYRPHSLTARIDGVRRAREGRGFDPRATDLWEDLKRVFAAVAAGHHEWGVPPYDGGLFIDDPEASPEGALLAQLHLANADFGPTLYGLAVDKDADGAVGKVDFGDLGVRHIGNLYEGLLSYEVAIADEDLSVDEDEPDQPYGPARAGRPVAVRRGEPYMRSPKGGRKASGSYYTPAFVVDRLVQQSVVPAFDRHLASIRDVDVSVAAERLWDFKVCDPAMGSGHFLVSVVDAISERIAAHLYERPLPGVAAELERARVAAQKTSESVGATEVAEVKDVDVLRRLVLKRCVYGVDLNPMAVELAQLSLWLHAFVPGLPLFYLGHTLRRGNSLFGTIGDEFEALLDRRPARALFGTVFRDKIQRELEPAREIARSPDLELHEVERSRQRQLELERIADEVRPYYDAFAADPLETGMARKRILTGELDVLADRVDRETSELLRRSGQICHGFDALHWTLAFPEVFLRERPGFDAVMANPPWEEVNVEELGFFARYMPGLKGERSREEQRRRIAQFVRHHPAERTAFDDAQRSARLMATYLKASFTLSSSGNADLYKAFAERFLQLCREGGSIGIVLPHSALLGEGSAPFRRALFDNSVSVRLDFLQNTRGWVFEDVHQQYLIALLSAEITKGRGATLSVAGPVSSHLEFAGIDEGRINWEPDELQSADYTIPLIKDQASATLFKHCYAAAPRFDANVGDWRSFGQQEFNATTEAKSGLLTEGARGWPVYSGDSFDLWNPDNEAPPFRTSERKGVAWLVSRHKGSSVWRREFPPAVISDPKMLPQYRARILVRDVTNRLNLRTVIACLVPPKVFAVNNAPGLVFPRGDERAQAYVLGVLCSLSFDWLARRRVERHLNLFILNSLPFPRPGPENPARRRVASLAARLACVDERFDDFAAANGVSTGPVPHEERLDAIAELDALVAHLYEMTAGQLEVVFADFAPSDSGAAPAHRAAVRRHFASLGR